MPARCYVSAPLRGLGSLVFEGALYLSARSNQGNTVAHNIPYSGKLKLSRIKGEATFRDSYFHDQSNLQKGVARIQCGAWLQWHGRVHCK